MNNEEIKEIAQNSWTPIEKLSLTPRTKCVLFRCGIIYVEQLVQREYNDLLKLRNIGIKSQKEIKEKVNALGFDFYESDFFG